MALSPGLPTTRTTGLPVVGFPSQRSSLHRSSSSPECDLWDFQKAWSDAKKRRVIPPPKRRRSLIRSASIHFLNTSKRLLFAANDDGDERPDSVTSSSMSHKSRSFSRSRKKKKSRHSFAPSAYWRSRATLRFMDNLDKEQDQMMRAARTQAMSENLKAPGQAGLLLTLLWQAGGVKRDDVVPLICYACDVPDESSNSARDVGLTIETIVAANLHLSSLAAEGKITSRQFGELVLFCERHGIAIEWDHRYSFVEKRFAFTTGLVPLTAKNRVRRRALFLQTIFQALVEHDSSRPTMQPTTPTVPLKKLHSALVALGETQTTKDLLGTLLADAEVSLDNLDAVVLPVFLKLMGHLDGGRQYHNRLPSNSSVRQSFVGPPKRKNSQRYSFTFTTHHGSAPMNTNTVRKKWQRLQTKYFRTKARVFLGPKQLPTSEFLQITRLFLLLDTSFAGRVQCAKLPQRIVELPSRFPHHARYFDGNFLFRFACMMSNSDMRDSDYCDVNELLDKALDFLKSKASQKDWIDHYADDKTLKSPTTVPWTSLLEKLPLSNHARARDFEDSLSSMADKNLRLLARDGSNIFHFFAHRGDVTACKLLLQRSHIRFLIADKNRAGVYAVAVAAARSHFDIVSLLRPWLEYILDARLYGDKLTHQSHLRNLCNLNNHQF